MLGSTDGKNEIYKNDKNMFLPDINMLGSTDGKDKIYKNDKNMFLPDINMLGSTDGKMDTDITSPS